MLTIKEAKKIPYTQLDEETKEYFYDIFKKYVVRKRIADNNKELSSLFARRLKTTNPKKFAGYFNDFNNRFVNANLISQLRGDEANTSYLRDLSEEAFNNYLKKTGRTFERKIGLICFSGRPSERIANRVEFPVLVAYANMQDRVLELALKNPNIDLPQIFQIAAKEVRLKFVKDNGKKINDTGIAEERTDYKSLGKKVAPVWKQMLEFYKKGLENIMVSEAANFVLENFIFTEKERREFIYFIEKAELELENDRNFMRTQADQMPQYYDVSDYDEVMYSKKYANSVFSNNLSQPINNIFDRILSDPIFAEKTPKQKNS